ncbi:MAG: XapX domain-containing protein [Akkermansiaceae bacterium]|nr:XapX domain-containing protein [Akkermansiaceae bacterium]NNM29174.1 XapX domain-containing protein [Akkermansiaceae bacterium]
MPFLKEIIAILLAFGIGALCGRFGIPVPSPPTWFGVLLIGMIWLGYVVTKGTTS